ncbi:HNH endonuclease [Nonomuraea turkmeniaca]|uniref:HNH endonuclease n=1 Tax=Nonomuraea turkmeniaca TaxID=103838 RepID=A0A5S4F6J5_9ACTN|nr:HNH endonuclease [Nonomuraea turkmeniaca]TMR11644.1 HNH endonuclease [Nonomuraea turkmeniaca]
MSPGNSRDRPDWRNESLGTMKRIALWLVDVVGEGNTFTKQQLHKAIPGTPQLDRRLRDLRVYGWVIDSDRSRPSLGPAELLFTKAGEPVWEPGATRSLTRRLLTPHIRDEVLSRDGFACVNCGLAVVEGPIEAPVEAILELAHITPLAAGGSSTPDNLITLCANCHKLLDSSTQSFSADDVWTQIEKLSAHDRTRLLAWMAMDRKPSSPAEKAWALYRRLSHDQRRTITHRLGQAVVEQTEGDLPST